MRLYPDQVPNVEASLPFYRAAADEWVALEARLGPFELVRKGGLMLAEGAEQLAFLEAKAEAGGAAGAGGGDARPRGARPDRAVARAADRRGGAVPGRRQAQPACRQCAAKGAGGGAGGRAAHGSGLRGSKRKALASLRFRERAAAMLPVRRSLPPPGARETIVRGLGVAIPTVAEPLHMNITEPGRVVIEHLVQHAERSITLKQFGSGQIVIGGGWPARGRGAGDAAGGGGGVASGERGAGGAAGAGDRRAQGHPDMGRDEHDDGRRVRHRAACRACPRVIAALPGDAGYTLGPLVARRSRRPSRGTACRPSIRGASPLPASRPSASAPARCG
jgi:hypothetical protein